MAGYPAEDKQLRNERRDAGVPRKRFDLRRVVWMNVPDFFDLLHARTSVPSVFLSPRIPKLAPQRRTRVIEGDPSD